MCRIIQTLHNKQDVIQTILMRTIMMLLATLLMTAPASARFDIQAVSPAVVRILILWDAPTHAQATTIIPRTGMVLNDRGEILVSSDHLQQAQGVLVLDGGTDPTRFGKTATILHQDAALGIAVIQTNALQRSVLPVNISSQQPVSAFNVVGFDDVPNQPLQLQPSVAIGQPQQSASSLPAGQFLHTALFQSARVSGALVNDCNQIVGFNIGIRDNGATSSGVAVDGAAIASSLQKAGIQLKTIAVACATSIPLSQQGQALQQQPAVVQPARTRTANDPSNIKEAQVLLNALKIPAGPPDGVMGTKTRSAVIVYQTGQKLPVDGRISVALLDHLEQTLRGGSASASQPASQPPANQPAGAQQAGNQPANSQPAAAQPIVNQPAAAQLSAQQQAATQGAGNQSANSQPGGGQPVATQLSPAQASSQQQVTGQPAGTQSSSSQAVDTTTPASHGASTQPAGSQQVDSSSTQAPVVQPQENGSLRWLWSGLAALLLLLILFILFKLMRRKSGAVPQGTPAQGNLQQAPPIAENIAQPGGARWSLYGELPGGGLVNLNISASGLSMDGLIIGRSGKGSDLVVNHDSVSRRHAKLFLSGGSLMIEDLGSVNGSRVDGGLLTPGMSTGLGEGIELKLGEVVLHLSVIEPGNQA